jgi:hypothetical protein
MGAVTLTGYKDYSDITLWSNEEQWVKATYDFATHGGTAAATTYSVAVLPKGYAIVDGFVKCTADVAGTSSTLEVGYTGATAAVIAQTAEASFVPNYIKGFVGAQAVSTTYNTIFMTIGTADLTAGTVDIYLKIKKA